MIKNRYLRAVVEESGRCEITTSMISKAEIMQKHKSFAAKLAFILSEHEWSEVYAEHTPHWQ